MSATYIEKGSITCFRKDHLIQPHGKKGQRVQSELEPLMTLFLRSLQTDSNIDPSLKDLLAFPSGSHCNFQVLEHDVLIQGKGFSKTFSLKMSPELLRQARHILDVANGIFASPRAYSPRPTSKVDSMEQQKGRRPTIDDITPTTPPVTPAPADLDTEIHFLTQTVKFLQGSCKKILNQCNTLLTQYKKDPAYANRLKISIFHRRLPEIPLLRPSHNLSKQKQVAGLTQQANLLQTTYETLKSQYDELLTYNHKIQKITPPPPDHDLDDAIAFANQSSSRPPPYDPEQFLF